MARQRANRTTALITGASWGIGLALAKESAQDGYDLAMVARNEAALQRSAAEIGNDTAVHVRTLAVDLSLSAAPIELFDWLSSRDQGSEDGCPGRHEQGPRVSRRVAPSHGRSRRVLILVANRKREGDKNMKSLESIRTPSSALQGLHISYLHRMKCSNINARRNGTDCNYDEQ